MLSVIINWLYMGVFIVVVGIALMQGYEWLFKDKTEKEVRMEFGICHVLFAGILGTTLYAQIFSIFYRVNMEANILLFILCIAYAIWQKNYFVSCFLAWRDSYRALKKGKWLLGVLLLLAALVFAMCSAGPAKLIDTDWYHAQTIRWIEEYGCVKGVANLFYALGFNNTQHYFDALFSMKWLFSQSLRASGGFFGFVILLHGSLRVARWTQHKRHIADLLAVWEVAYSIIVTAFFADPYVDTLPNVLVLFIMTEWFALLEEQSEDTYWYGFYCLLALFALLCKTSVAMVVLLSFYVVYLLCRQGKPLRILGYLGVGFGISLPFLITNVITTGYPVYLLSALDLFDVPWKIDAEVLRYSVDNMVAFARMPLVTMEEALNCGLAWVPGWFLAESISHQILYLVIAAIVLYDLGCTAMRLLRRESMEMSFLYPRLCVYLGLLYWFFTIPQVKYCWSFLIFPLAVVPMYAWETVRKEKPHTILQKGILAASLLVLCMYVGFYSIRTLGYAKEGLQEHLLRQTDYEDHVFDTVTKNGHTFYTRIENGDIVCGYYVFPYLDNKEDLDRLFVGESLGEGFYFETAEK